MAPHDPSAKLKLVKNFDDNVAILKIFPSINQATVESFFKIKGLRGVILETYGSGNTMNFDWFLKILENAMKKGIIIYNVSQCSGGEVIQGRYETSKRLNDIGIVSGGDITTEAAVSKLMFLLGNEKNEASIRRKLAIPLNGEMDN